MTLLVKPQISFQYLMFIISFMACSFYPNLDRNTTEYRYNHKCRDAVEETLYFINIKELKYPYIQNGNKLSQVMVAYL